VTHNKVERVRSVYEENVFLRSVENVGKDYALGMEIMLNAAPWKWWNANLMGSVYDYRVDGTLYGRSFDEESFSWKIRFNNTFRIDRSTRFQVNGVYMSPIAKSQGEWEGFGLADVALKQELFDRKLSATLQVRDVLSTGQFEFASEGPGFYSLSHFERKSPSVTLTLAYNFNNYKPERRKQEDLELFEPEQQF
jgi:hypothetical protein